MSNLYKTLNKLCEERGITGYRMCKDIGIQPSIMTDLKMERRSSVKAETAAKMADYFHVPIGFLMGRPPFDVWDEIELNRKKFIDASGIDARLLNVLFNINFDHPDDAPLTYFIKFVNEAIDSAIILPDGKWSIKVNKTYKGRTTGAFLRIIPQDKLLPSIARERGNYQEKAPTPEGERQIDNPDIRMIARAGKKMTPDQAENLRKYAQYMFPEAFKDDDT